MQNSPNLPFQVILQVDFRWPLTLICDLLTTWTYEGSHIVSINQVWFKSDFNFSNEVIFTFSAYLTTWPQMTLVYDLWPHEHMKIPIITITYLPTFKFQKEEQMREKNLKRGTFLNFLYITIQRLLQKQEHMIKSFSFLLRKEELFLQKRNSWQVCNKPSLVLIGLQLFNWGQFYIFRQSHNS